MLKRLACASAMLVAGACSYRSGPTQPPEQVASVTVSAAVTNPTVGVGQTVQLTATPRDSQGNTMTGLAVVWISSDQTSATVDGTGLVLGVKAGGSSKISALIQGATGSLTVVVTP